MNSRFRAEETQFMLPFDPGTLVNWIVSGFISACFAVLVTSMTYRYQRKRDDIKWERRLADLEKRSADKAKVMIRKSLIKDSDQTARAIKEMKLAQDMIRGRPMTFPGSLSTIPTNREISVTGRARTIAPKRKPSQRKRRAIKK